MLILNHPKEGQMKTRNPAHPIATAAQSAAKEKRKQYLGTLT